ncbi:barstar family protein [Streptomyces syringium]|uniref:barstar family protein n=1 Tax=Streptomyces syringium TaxID=76729 RepID=UPI0033FBBF25
MEFRSGLTVITPAEVSSILVEGARQEIPVFVLATEGRVDRESFFRAVRETLPLDPPLVSSRSWDALSDSLWEGVHKMASPHAVIVWCDAVFPDSESTGDDFQIALSVLQDVVESLADSCAANGTPKVLSVYVAAASKA